MAENSPEEQHNIESSSTAAHIVVKTEKQDVNEVAMIPVKDNKIQTIGKAISEKNVKSAV